MAPKCVILVFFSGKSGRLWLFFLQIWNLAPSLLWTWKALIPLNRALKRRLDAIKNWCETVRTYNFLHTTAPFKDCDLFFANFRNLAPKFAHNSKPLLTEFTRTNYRFSPRSQSLSMYAFAESPWPLLDLSEPQPEIFNRAPLRSRIRKIEIESCIKCQRENEASKRQRSTPLHNKLVQRYASESFLFIHKHSHISSLDYL